MEHKNKPSYKKMSILKATKVVIAIGTLLSISFSAQSMDLLQVYEAAKTQDARLKAAKFTAASERERVPQALSQMLPQISANLSRTENNLESTSLDIQQQQQTTKNDYPSTSKTLSLRQPIYRPQIAAQYRQAKAQVIDAEAALALEDQNLAVRVSGAYFEAMLTHDQLNLVQAQQVSYQTELDAARKMFKSGYGTRTDIDEAQSRIDMNYALEIEARQNVSYTMQQLQSMTRDPIGELVILDIDKLELSPMEPNNLEDWMSRAEKRSPQMQSLQARVDIARQEIDKSKSGHYPTLDATVQWQQSESESVTNISNRYTNSSIGVQLNIPIYSGGYVSATVRQAVAAHERAKENLEVGRLDLNLKVHKEFRGVTESIHKIKALEQALRSADQLILSSRKSFKGGNRTILDILNAEQQRVVTLRDLAQTRYTYLISKVRLLALVGEANINAIVDINNALKISTEKTDGMFFDKESLSLKFIDELKIPKKAS